MSGDLPQLKGKTPRHLKTSDHGHGHGHGHGYDYDYDYDYDHEQLPDMSETELRIRLMKD